MGKKLIIKDADFAQNAIQDIDYSVTTLYQLLTVTNPNSANYGKISDNVTYASFKISDIPAGKSVRFFVTDNGVTINNLAASAISSTNSYAMTNGTVVTNIVQQHDTETGGVITFENTYSTSTYMYVLVSYQPHAAPSEHMSITGKTVYYAIVD